MQNRKTCLILINNSVLNKIILIILKAPSENNNLQKKTEKVVLNLINFYII